MQTLNMMTIWLNVQFFCILQRGFQSLFCLVIMEVTREDVPMQMLEVLGNLALDYGAQNGHMMKRRRGQPSKTSLPKNESKEEVDPKITQVMAQLLLRHERDMMALQSQNSFVMFMATTKEGMMAPLIQESAAWKKAQQSSQVTMPLRQHLFQFLLKTLIQRVAKLKTCTPEDQLWQSGRDADTLGTDASHVRTAGPDHQIPLTSKQNQGCPSNPLEAGNRDEKDQCTGGQHGLAVGFLEDQKAPSCPMQIGGR